MYTCRIERSNQLETLIILIAPLWAQTHYPGKGYEVMERAGSIKFILVFSFSFDFPFNEKMEKYNSKTDRGFLEAA